MPSLGIPRIDRGRRVTRSPVCPSMSWAPASANGTIAPWRRFVAPVTTTLRLPPP